MSRLVDVVGEFLRRVEASRSASMAGRYLPNPSDLFLEMEAAWQEARKGEESLPALVEAACRKAIERGQSSDALNFYALLAQMRESPRPGVTNG